MKYSIVTFLIATLIAQVAQAQTQQPKREVLIRYFEHDSVNISFTNDYYFIEDSCADIIRLGHYDGYRRKFKGSFVDVSRLNPHQIIAQGSYDETGRKDGHFISYYPNGNPQANGNFEKEMFVGRWNFFYPSGPPKLSFDADSLHIKILNAWSEKGKKTVDNGNGVYESVIGPIVWRGRLSNGTPDGRWTANRMFGRPEDVLATEIFKNGVFQKGNNSMGVYRDTSHILLASTDLLSLVKGEQLWLASVPCNGVAAKTINGARYAAGAQQFKIAIKDHLEPVLGSLQLSQFAEPIELQGKVLTNGRILLYAGKGIDQKLLPAFSSGLNGLPLLLPATVDGKAAEQEILITIRYNSSVYIFTYSLLAVKGI